MESDFFTIFLWIIILGPILGGVFWVIAIIRFAKQSIDHVSNANNMFGNQGSMYGMSYGDQQFIALMNQIQAMVQQQQQQQGQMNLNDMQKMELNNLMMKAQLEYNQMNELSRQRHDLHMADMMGMAANAGIDFNPNGY